MRVAFFSMKQMQIFTQLKYFAEGGNFYIQFNSQAIIKQSIRMNPSNEEDEVHYISSNDIQKSKILTGQEIFVDQLYEDLKVKIKSFAGQRTFKIETFFYTIIVISQSQNKSWQIQRRYSDFQWLFNALIFSFPGIILPYFPVKSIENYMVTKLGLQYGAQSKQQHLSQRKNQLELFLNGILSHPTLKQAEETKIFLNQISQQFAKNKKIVQAQILESQSQQSSSNGIVSIFQRSFAWITSSSKSDNAKIQSLQGWDAAQKQITFWVDHYSNLVAKVQKLIELKRVQAQWQGPDTQIDSVQQLKAKIVSGKNYNYIFQEELRGNIIKNLDYQTKSLKQLQYQLDQRRNIINIINYIYKFGGSNNRSNKLLRKKEKFQQNMLNEWPKMKQQLRNRIRAIQNKFNQVWVRYCRNVSSIWRKK